MTQEWLASLFVSSLIDRVSFYDLLKNLRGKSVSIGIRNGLMLDEEEVPEDEVKRRKFSFAQKKRQRLSEEL